MQNKRTKNCGRARLLEGIVCALTKWCLKWRGGSQTFKTSIIYKIPWLHFEKSCIQKCSKKNILKNSEMDNFHWNLTTNRTPRDRDAKKGTKGATGTPKGWGRQRIEKSLFFLFLMRFDYPRNWRAGAVQSSKATPDAQVQTRMKIVEFSIFPELRIFPSRNFLLWLFGFFDATFLASNQGNLDRIEVLKSWDSLLHFKHHFLGTGRYPVLCDERGGQPTH